MGLVRAPAGGEDDVVDDDLRKGEPAGVGVAHVRFVRMLEAEKKR